jgi:hypothetical protein
MTQEKFMATEQSMPSVDSFLACPTLYNHHPHSTAPPLLHVDLSADWSVVQPLEFLSPFLKLVREPEVSGPITGVALTSLWRLLSGGILGELLLLLLVVVVVLSTAHKEQVELSSAGLSVLLLAWLFMQQKHRRLLQCGWFPRG